MAILRFWKLLCVQLIGILFLCEFLIYYVQLSQCSWPQNVTPYEEKAPLHVMLLADTHLLGPRRGHWFDKLRREWQMHRAFQSALVLLQPEAVVILGDVFDEGKWVDDKEWQEYVRRFRRLFHTPPHMQMLAVVGNHDIGFHYDTSPKHVQRFEAEFQSKAVQLHTIRDIHFVVINSVTMQGDGCNLCQAAQRQLKNVSRILKCARNIGSNCDRVKRKLGTYSAPVLLQHYPLYRESDSECDEHDSPTVEQYRELWDVLSQEATDLIGESLEPRLAFSGHSHNFCRLQNRRLNIEEYTIPSFSWRNRNNPAFALLKITEKDYEISMCDMPRETTVIAIYKVGAFLALLVCILDVILCKRMNNNKTHIKDL